MKDQRGKHIRDDRQLTERVVGIICNMRNEELYMRLRITLIKYSTKFNEILYSKHMFKEDNKVSVQKDHVKYSFINVDKRLRVCGNHCRSLILL